MAWINPLYEEHQRQRWLRHDWQRFLTPVGLEAEKRAAEERARAVCAAEQKAFEDELWQVRRDLDALKVELAARRAARRQEAEALRRKSDLAFERFLSTFKRYAEQQKAGFNPAQLRDDQGKWTDAGSGDKEPADDARKPELVTKPAFLRGPAAPPLGIPPALNPGNRTAIENQLSRSIFSRA